MLLMVVWTCSEVVAAEAVTISAAGDYSPMVTYTTFPLYGYCLTLLLNYAQLMRISTE